MLDVLTGFVHELRAVGIPVSMTEALDAGAAVEAVGLRDRKILETVLAAALVKRPGHRRAFELVFDVYFPLHAPGVGDGGALDAEQSGAEPSSASPNEATPSDRDDLLAELLDALATMDTERLRRLAAMAVTAFAGMEPGRPVGGTYYLYRTLRQLDLAALELRLVERAEEAAVATGPLDRRLRREEQARRVRTLRELVEAEIRRRLVADRGVESMARTVRAPLPEDVDFLHASRDEMLELQRSIVPLARSLAARLAQRRRRRHRGQLDVRRTMRESLSYGGVPVEPRFRKAHPAKPEVMVIADVSGSVASFARFTLQFVYAMSAQFSNVRSWAFIDGIDEVTHFFDESDDVAEAVRRVNTEADVIWMDGHSDYGHAFETFEARHGREVTPRSSVIILGDARSNYHAPQASALEGVRDRARRVYWLNPEPRSYWNTGDSVVASYEPYCDGVYECRTLRQLERFVSLIGS